MSPLSGPTIDYEFHRRQALRLRRQARGSLLRPLALTLIARLRALAGKSAEAGPSLAPRLTPPARS